MREILKYLKNYRKEVYTISIVSLAIAVLSAIMPYIFGRLLDLVMATGTYRNREVYELLVLGLIMGTAIDIFNTYVYRAKSNLGNKCERDLVVNTSGYYLLLPMDLHKELGDGDILSRISKAGYFLSSIVNQVIFQSLPDFVALVFSLFIIASMSYKVAGMLVLILAFYTIVTWSRANRLVDQEQNVRKAYESTYDNLYDSAANIVTIKTSGTENEEKKGYLNDYQKILDESVAKIKLWSNTQFYQSTILGKGMLAAFFLLMVLLTDKEISTGQILAIYAYLGLVQKPLATLSGNYLMIRTSLISIKRANAIMTEKPEPYDKGIIPEKIIGKIEFRDFSFSHNGDQKELLHHINFTAKPGKIIGLVGPSGMGKSTIKDVFLRLTDGRKSGQVLLDGIDIEDINITWLRKNVAIVSQEAKMFNKTIRYNLGYGLRSVTFEDISWAANLANANGFIERFPKKFEHRVGKGGEKLSGGQRQRLDIARAILKDAQLIFMDEPTSNQDSISAKNIRDALKLVFPGKTVICIGHRFCDIKDICDEILVLNDGEIAERGTHEELMVLDGLYRQMYLLQQ